MTDFHDIPTDRLMEAVDAIYAAARELGTEGFYGPPSGLLGTPDQPEAFCDFTRDEIRAAELFLARCGLITAGSR